MKRLKGCLKYGCFGCIGVVGLFLIASLVIGVGALVSDKTVSQEQRELVQALPLFDLPVEDPSQATTDELLQPLFRFGDIDPGAPGVVDVKLSVGSFVIEPGPAGEPIRVEADFDTNRYKLEQHYEPAAGGEGWTYKVRFGPKGFFKWFNIQDGGPPEVRVIIPRDSPFALQGKISMGESEVELGGLWVTAVNLVTGMGEHKVSFDEPVMTPIEEFQLDGSMGALSVHNLGNASPKTASVKLSTGELGLDLRGPWAQDADIQVRSSMGECGVRLPDDVNIDLQRAAIGLGERNISGARDRDEIPGAPTLHLNAAHSMGELRIR